MKKSLLMPSICNAIINSPHPTMPPSDYQNSARYYDLLVGSLVRGLRRTALHMCPPAPGASVLEAACGTAANLFLFQQAGWSVSGLDRSPDMLAVARRKLGATARIALGSTQGMPFASGSFDLALIMLALHEMPQPVRLGTLGEMRRVVKPGGKVLLVDFHTGPFQFPLGWINHTGIALVEHRAGGEHYQGYLDFMQRGGLPPLAELAGLGVESVTLAWGGASLLVLAS
jgi:ubiquinone/menaquinone biosynthesis C-methylase UbiE